MSARFKLQASCPSCGAPVELASSASSFAVCGFCHSGLSRDGDVLQRIGAMSQVLEDYSPIQLGASGVWDGQAFTVVGRIQMTYPGGFWNEWHLFYPDGSSGWLSDASGQYAVLTPVRSAEDAASSSTHGKPLAAPLDLPRYEALAPGRSVPLLGQTFVVSDRREAQCTGAQGELPFAVSERWTGRVADLRQANQLLTLDYSDGEPVLYKGTAVALPDLKMQLLRDEHTINESAGRLKGKLQPLSCPSCGSGIKAVAGATPVANCGSCGSVLDVSGKAALLMDKGQKAHGRTRGAFLEAGDAGVLRGVSWTVLGVIQQSSTVDGETYRWTDYLLFNVKSGFRWLSQSADDQWSWVEVLDTWPTSLKERQVSYRGARFDVSDDYRSQVDRVWGSFNWLVRAGDTTECVEFKVARSTAEVPAGSILVRETAAEEQTWSFCAPIKAEMVATAFGKRKPVARPAPVVEREMAEPVDFGSMLKYGGMGHLVLWGMNPTMLGFTVGIVTAVALGIAMALEET